MMLIFFQFLTFSCQTYKIFDNFYMETTTVNKVLNNAENTWFLKRFLAENVIR